MKRFFVLVIALSSMAAMGCYRPATEASSTHTPADSGHEGGKSVAEQEYMPAGAGYFADAGETYDAYVDKLKTRARDLAEKELARMTAAELTYRNKSQLHRIVTTAHMGQMGVHIKMYRHFTEFDVRDIYRSESYIYPVAYEIEYDYRLMGTEPRPINLPNAAELSQNDRDFTSLGEFSLTRRYKCDRHGNYIGSLPDLPPRPDFYKRGRDTEEADEARPNMLPPGGFMTQGGQSMPPRMDLVPPPPGGSF